MQKINDIDKLKRYIEEHNIKDFFSNDMKEYMYLYKFEKNEYICIQDDKLEYLFFLVDGKAKVCKHMEDGKTFLITFYNPLSMIGEMEFTLERDADCTVECLCETYCIGIKRDNVKGILINDNKFLLNICKNMGKKLSSNSTNNSINLLHPLENRFASYVMALLTEKESHEYRFEFKETYSETAELLGTSYRHLNRIINKFCKEGIISKKEGYYIVEDINKLKCHSKDLYKWNL